MSQALGQNKLHQKGGPDGEAVVAYLLENKNQPIHVDTISAATDIPSSKIAAILGDRVAKAREGSKEALQVYRPLEGRMRRVKLGVYYFDTKSDPAPVAATTTKKAGGTSALATGNLMEVLKSYDNGRVILACEKGRIYSGTLILVDG